MTVHRRRNSDAYLACLGLTQAPKVGTARRIDFEIIRQLDMHGYGTASSLCAAGKCTPAKLRQRMVRLRDLGVVRRVKAGSEATRLGCVTVLRERRAYCFTAPAALVVAQVRAEQSDKYVLEGKKTPARKLAGRW